MTRGWCNATFKTEWSNFFFNYKIEQNVKFLEITEIKRVYFSLGPKYLHDALFKICQTFYQFFLLVKSKSVFFLMFKIFQFTQTFSEIIFDFRFFVVGTKKTWISRKWKLFMCYGRSSHVLFFAIRTSSMRGLKIPDEDWQQHNDKKKNVKTNVPLGFSAIRFDFFFVKTFRSNGPNYFPINNIGVTLIVANKNRILVQHINFFVKACSWAESRLSARTIHVDYMYIYFCIYLFFFSCSVLRTNTMHALFLYLFCFFSLAWVCVLLVALSIAKQAKRVWK